MKSPKALLKISAASIALVALTGALVQAQTGAANAGAASKTDSGKQNVDLSGVKSAQIQSDSLSGYRLKNYPVNDLFQYLARLAGKQYFQNPSLNGLTISGQMMDGDPVKRMQEVAFQYGISLYEKGSTIYAMPAAEVSNLPLRQAEFKLRYLRSDAAKLKELLVPYLTKGVGSVEYEDKTNTLIVHDNEPAISRVKELLARVDVQQRQVTIQVRIFRVTIDSGREWGVSWEQTLGKNGLNLQATAVTALKEVFGVSVAENVLNSLTQTLKDTNGVLDMATEEKNSVTDKDDTTRTSTLTRDLTFGPVALNAVLRALYENADASQESAPTIITEDNETAVFSHLDKIPIVTVTSTTGTGPTVDAPEVRYQPDPEDPFDIGLKLTVKPTILPNNTIRLKITPSIGTVTSNVKAGNYEYPKVLLASIENIATVPNGYTLVFGGFSQYSDIEQGNKVPLLGDIPVLNFFFSSKSNLKARTNLVFFVTATATGLDSETAVAESERVRRDLISDPSARWADDSRVGSTAEANLARTVQNDFSPFSEKTNERYNPVWHATGDNANLPKLKTPQQANQERVISTLPQAVPAPTPAKKRGFRPWEAIVPPRS
jgi:type II secretory pathway component GspD/PulD (secretin)